MGRKVHTQHGRYHGPTGEDPVPESVFPVYAEIDGSATLASTGAVQVIPISFVQTNDVTVFGTGDSRTADPTNVTGDDFLLLMKPGIYMYTVAFITIPDVTAASVRFRVDSPPSDSYYQTFSQPSSTRITYHGMGAVPTSYLPGPLWGELSARYLNSSGSNQTIEFKAYVHGVVTDSNMPDLTTLI